MIILPPKLIVWMGSSREALRLFPEAVRRDIGQALYTAQQGETDPAARPLKGFGGIRVMEIVDRHDTDTYRAELVRQRLAAAQRHDKERRN